MAKVTPRQRQATEIRDKVIKKLKEDPSHEIISEGRVVVWNQPPFYAVLGTPFDRWRAEYPTPRNYDEALLINKLPTNPPYSIELWYEDRKVFFFEWVGEELGTIVSFRRGDWEQQLLSLI